MNNNNNNNNNHDDIYSAVIYGASHVREFTVNGHILATIYYLYFKYIYVISVLCVFKLWCVCMFDIGLVYILLPVYVMKNEK